MSLDQPSLRATIENRTATSQRLFLEDREVHVWVCSIAFDHAQTVRHARWLSPQEARKASAFQFEEDRKRYINSHGILRRILSRYMPIHPPEFAFGSAPGGKPFLHVTPTGESVRFNVSHTKKLAAFAITRTIDVGIDIECVREVRQMDAILARFLSPSQLQDIKGRPHEDRTRAFFRWWTASEALLKARGKGIDALGEGLDFVPIGRLPSAFCVGEHDADWQWSLWSNEVEPDHILAVAAKGEDLSLHYCDYSTVIDFEKETWP